jgi:hypothetical protein
MDRFEKIMRVVIVLAVVLAAMMVLSAITGGGR